MNRTNKKWTKISIYFHWLISFNTMQTTLCPKIISGPTIDPETTTSGIEERAKYREKAEWGSNGLVAVCSQFHIQIVDPISVQTITTLYGHRFPATAVKWCPLSNTNSMERGNSTILASGDESGTIIIWDIKLSKVLYIFDSGYKSGVICFKWVDNTFKYLLVLFGNNMLVCYNVPQSTKVWAKQFTDPLISMTINPFDKTMAACAATNGRIYLISDLNVVSAPDRVEQKLKVGEVKDSVTGQLVSNLKDIEFSPHCRDHLFLITKREVAIYDLQLKQTLLGKSIHGAKSDFKKISLFESYPNKVFSVHEDGRAGIWTVDEVNRNIESTMCDSVRGNKHGGERPGLLHSACFSERYPNMLTAISADGKIWIWKVQKNDETTDWVLHGLLESITSQISSFQVSPFGNLVAVGTHNGHLHVFNLMNSTLESRHDLFSGHSVHGVRWFASDKIIAFSTKTVSKGVFENKVMVLNLSSGKSSLIRKDRKQESTWIKAIRVSSTSSLMVLVLANRPMEIWDLKTVSLSRILSYPDVLAFEFRVSTQNKEYFSFVVPDGTLYIYRVEKNDFVQDKVKTKVFASSPTSCLAWKNEFLIAGDAAGVITTMEFDKKRSRSTNTGKGAIRKIRFSPDNNFISVVFSSGLFSIYELENLTCLANCPSHVKAIGSDWGVGNYPIFATKSGNLFIFDVGLLSCNSNIIFRQLIEPMRSLTCLPKEQSLCLSEILKNEVIKLENSSGSGDKVKNEFGEVFDDKIVHGTFINKVKSHFDLLDEESLQVFGNSNASTAQRCLVTATLIGDEIGMKFWTLAIQYMKQFKNGIPVDSIKEEVVQDYQAKKKVTDINSAPNLVPSFDLLRQDDEVKRDETLRVKNLDDSLRSSASKESSGMFSVIAQSQVFVDRKDEAVSLLMDTPTTHKDLFKNYLHACVISASNSKDHFISTVQVIATSLISLKSEEEFDMGVELLCLIGEGYKACKVLQDCDKWEKAARIAKSILPEDKKRLILMRWASNLSSTNTFMSIGVYLSLGLFVDVLENLHDAKLDDLAAMFIKACEEEKIPMVGKEKFSDQDFSEERFATLRNDIHVSYAKYLDKIGYKTLSLEYHHAEKKEVTNEIKEEVVYVN
jgi:WD40 repeat protein